MRFGKIRVENKELRFSRMMKSYQIPCEEIKWAYRRKEDANGRMCCGTATFTMNFVIILTKGRKRYQFEMTEEEAKACLLYLKESSPNMIIGFPRGGALPLNSVFNTRDLGGIKAEDGRHILPRQLLRSGDLYHLSESDVRFLEEECHLSTVLDFRTEAERRQKPDTVMDKVTYINHPILEEETLGISRESGLEEMIINMNGDPENYMMTMYQQLVLNSRCKSQYAEFFHYLINQEKDRAILWHCSAGKDRAGVASMLLLAALGVPRGAILDDYMRTNTCLYKELEYTMRYMEAKGCLEAVLNRMRTMLSAKECYLQSAMDTIQMEYGSMERYLRQEMYLSARKLNQLKDRYLV